MIATPFHRSERPVFVPLLLCVTLSVFLLAVPAAARDSSPTTTPLMQRIVDDIAAGKPLVTTVYVALCDNDSQGIVPVRNRSICNGDDPARNIYWKGNGISGYLSAHGWKNSLETHADGPVLIQQVWKKQLIAGHELRKAGVPHRFTAYVVARAYRGSRIHDAMKDYLEAVHHDTVETVTLKDGTRIEAGGKSHLVGYVGHDYFMDVAEGTARWYDLTASGKNRTSSLYKGTFALACVSNEFVRPSVSFSNIYILVMNNFLTYPSAWTIGGIIDGISAGGDGKTIYRQAARQFARGQKCGMKWALKAFSWGPQE